MIIETVSEPNLYAVRYGGDKENIYRCILKDFRNQQYTGNYFSHFTDRISDWVVDTYGYDKTETDLYMYLVQQQSYEIETRIRDCCYDFTAGRDRSLDDIFIPYDNNETRHNHIGKYLRLKCYGTKDSLIRIYALEIEPNCDLIIYGAIKITKRTQESPAFDRKGNDSTIHDELEKRVKSVSRFLETEGIVDYQGLMQYMEEDHEEEE